MSFSFLVHSFLSLSCRINSWSLIHIGSCCFCLLLLLLLMVLCYTSSIGTVCAHTKRRCSYLHAPHSTYRTAMRGLDKICIHSNPIVFFAAFLHQPCPFTSMVLLVLLPLFMLLWCYSCSDVMLSLYCACCCQ